MTPGRNDPCSCGSGRKYKKCCLGKPTKPRTTSITLDMGEPVKVRAFAMSPSGEIQLIGEDDKPLRHISATIERSYDRPKGPKVLSRVPLGNRAKLIADPDRALLQFDTIFAVDSNSRSINGRMVSVAAITLCKWLQRDPTPVVGFAPTQAMEFRDVDCHPDLLALKHFLIRLRETPNISEAGRIGIVIDSHLGDLPKIEARDVPLLDDYFLPVWVSLIYASDSASDRISNVLLRESDKAATRLLRQIEGGDWKDTSQEPFFDHGDYFRVWSF